MQAVGRGTGHVVGRSEDVWLPFIASVIERQLAGATASEDRKPTTLREIDRSSDWVSDRRGTLRSASGVATGRPIDGSWLPDAGTTLAYKALSTCDRSLAIVATPTTGALPMGSPLRLRTESPDAATWATVEMWICSERRKVLTCENPELELRLTDPGVHSIAIGRRDDGRVSLSASRAWVVEAWSTEAGR